METESTYEQYLRCSGLLREEEALNAYHELIDLEVIDKEVARFADYLEDVNTQISSSALSEQEVQHLYSYQVPMVSEDGYCTVLGEMSPDPYSLEKVLGGRSAQDTQHLQRLNAFVEFVREETGVDWIGIYRRFDIAGEDSRLVKLAYRGIPSRAEFPLTEKFAEKSNNSKVGLSGKAIIINNLNVHLEKGGAYYVCDDLVQSEACLPIFDSSYQNVIGIIDAESTDKYSFTSSRIATLIALSVVLSDYLLEI